MSSQITSPFKIESWEETSFAESEDGLKLTRASVTQSYSGALEAKSTIEYLMTTLPNEFTSFIGIEYIEGQIEGRSGSFVLQHEGTHENGIAKSSFTIVSGSGTEELSGIQGEGHYEATHEKAISTIHYHFE